MSRLLKASTKTIRIIATVLFWATITGGCSTSDPPVEDKKFAVPKIPFDPKTYVIYKNNELIGVDGKLDEEIWKKTSWTDDFVDIRGEQAPEPEQKTRVKIIWDEEFLYIGAELEEDDIWATKTQRDARIYLDNALEVFIDPDGDTHNYLEFQINARETIWDLYLNRPYRDGGLGLSGWNLLDYQAAVHLEGTLNIPQSKDQKWTIELALPMSALLEVDPDRKLKDGDQWRVNFSRAQRRLEVVDNQYRLKINPDTDRPYGVDFSVWSPQGLRNIHYPEVWGYVQFSNIIAGEETDTFNPNPDEQIKWALRQVYYQLKEFHMNHGWYTDNLSNLNLEDIQIEGVKFAPEIALTKTMFEVSASDDSSKKTWYINQNGRVWMKETK